MKPSPPDSPFESPRNVDSPHTPSPQPFPILEHSRTRTLILFQNTTRVIM